MCKFHLDTRARTDGLLSTLKWGNECGEILRKILETSTLNCRRF